MQLLAAAVGWVILACTVAVALGRALATGNPAPRPPRRTAYGQRVHGLVSERCALSAVIGDVIEQHYLERPGAEWKTRRYIVTGVDGEWLVLAEDPEIADPEPWRMA